MQNENLRLHVPEGSIFKATEVTEKTSPEIYNEIYNFLSDMKGEMGVFEHFQKYFTNQNIENQTKKFDRIKESIFWKENGKRHASFLRCVDPKNQSKADISAVVVLISDNERKIVDFGIFIEPGLQGQGIAKKFCIPEIKRLFKEHYVDVGKDYKLVVSKPTEEAKRMLVSAGATLIQLEDPEYFEVIF